MAVSKRYNQIFSRLGIFIAILMATVLVAGCSARFVPQGDEDVSAASSSVSSSGRPINGATQSSSGGAVTIDAEWKGDRDGSLVFSIAMNTHSVELDQYDLGKLAILRDNEGREYSAASWDSARGGHHRQGTLTFPYPESLSQGTAEYLEMIIRDVAGVKEMVLKWEL